MQFSYVFAVNLPKLFFVKSIGKDKYLQLKTVY